MLDPAQNHTFRDHYLEVDLDLSDVVFIATANVMETIPSARAGPDGAGPLDGYTEDEKVTIAREPPAALASSSGPGLRPASRGVGRGRRAADGIAAEYTREAGVRSAGAGWWPGFCARWRQGARRRQAGSENGRDRDRTSRNGVRDRTVGGITRLPGAAAVHRPESAERTAVPGVATGLAVTGAGGDVLFIEAAA